jgi:hypothetical protein
MTALRLPGLEFPVRPERSGWYFCAVGIPMGYQDKSTKSLQIISLLRICRL